MSFGGIQEGEVIGRERVEEEEAKLGGIDWEGGAWLKNLSIVVVVTPEEFLIRT
jgi:hypothetical protein